MYQHSYENIKLNSIFSKMRTESIFSWTCLHCWFYWCYCTFSNRFVLCYFLVFYWFIFFWKVIKTYNFSIFVMRLRRNKDISLFCFWLAFILLPILLSDLDVILEVFFRLVLFILNVEKRFILFSYVLCITHNFRILEFLCWIGTLLKRKLIYYTFLSR